LRQSNDEENVIHDDIVGPVVDTLGIITGRNIENTMKEPEIKETTYKV
jgi:hypothetical protein